MNTNSGTTIHRLMMILMILLYTSILNIQVKAQTNDSTITPAFDEVFNNSSANPGEISCESYTPTGICKDFLSEFDHPVKFALNTTSGYNFSYYEEQVLKFTMSSSSSVSNIHDHCLKTLERFLCRWVFFPTCDPESDVPVKQNRCRRACDILTIFECPEMWQNYVKQRDILDIPQGPSVSCDNLMYANGGDVPDCVDPLDGGVIPAFSITNNCFFGRGRGYSGNISTTKSNKTCQRWSEQAPHQFILPSSQYPELAGDHNYCRNPGSRAPDGPWCFTTDPDTRWEYCDVPQCESPTSCELYPNTPNAVCFGYGSIGYDYVFLNKSNVKKENHCESESSTKDILNCKLKRFKTSLNMSNTDFPPECTDIIFSLMCYHSFPLCDYNSSIPAPRKVCRSYCEEVSTGKCNGLWEKMKIAPGLKIITLPDCKTLPSPEGGDYVECFIPYNIGRNARDINTTKCYSVDDLGIHYNGTVNVTESGRCCQNWDSDTPHLHPLTSEFRYYLEGHNYCRNPEGRGKRPWCYTMDPGVRWEYCNVPQCVNDNASSSSTRNNFVLLGVAVTIPLLIIVVVILAVVICVLCTVKERAKVLYKLNKSPNNSTCEETICNDNYVPAQTVDIGQLHNIPRENITCIKELGQGNFGMVMKGEAKDVIPDQPSTLVAIKILKEGSNGDTRSNFVHEAVLVNRFDHPNILKLLGVCFDVEPFYIIFEYMELGDLNHYLRNKAISDGQSSSNITLQNLVDMAINIAAGLDYLAECRFIHRDLATRNCLINKQLFVKIADFGLSKDVYSKDYYRLEEKSLLPIRWMPPEAILYRKFTTQSDIWSFGIVLWEIFAGGVQPYCTFSNEEVVDYVTNKKVLQCPNNCPSHLYKLMVDCWKADPESRPTASEVYTRLQNWSPELPANNVKPTFLHHRNGSLTLNCETTV